MQCPSPMDNGFSSSRRMAINCGYVQHEDGVKSTGPTHYPGGSSQPPGSCYHSDVQTMDQCWQKSKLLQHHVTVHGCRGRRLD
eukprot:5714565-Karenia_brevis.AAC.1